MEFCTGKDIFVSLPTGYGKTPIFAVLPSLLIRLALFTYAASVKVLHPAAQLERASASVMSHLAFILLFAYSLHCCGKRLPVSLCVGGRVLAYIGYIYVPDSFRPRVTQRIKWPADGWGLIYETSVCGLLPFAPFRSYATRNATDS